MTNVVIDIAAQFTGKPAFKKADTAVSQLNKNTQNLGRTLTRTFGTAAVVAFGRASVKAFAEDDKAATSLGQTLKNLNLAYGSNIGTVNGYISRLEAQTGVLDDELRPAMDRLLRATGSVGKSQELLNLALDVAAGTGKSVTQVSQSLQKAYLGQTQALGRLGVGLSKAELTSSSFEEIQERLTTLFAGQATAAAETFAGQLDKLTIAANNAKETIGKGLYDAITALSGGGTTAATDNIDKLAKGIADSLANAGEFIDRLEKLKPVLIGVGIVAAAAFLPVTTAIAGAIWLMGDLNKRFKELDFSKGIIPGGMGNISMTVSGQVDNRVLKNQKTITKLTKEQAAAQAKILKDKKLQNALDKANLALGKGTDVFDMDKIQNAAALTNQAELLGKATTGSQLLQIANDTARLNVKKSILALEDAIASKDEAAITAATKKLNEDLKILNTLSGQNIQMASIKSILASLIPKDLVNQKNLDDALAKIREMLALLSQVAMPTITAGAGALGGGTTGGLTGGTTGGLTGGTTTDADQAARDAALRAFFEEQSALRDAGRGITDEGIVGVVIDPITAGASIDAILEYADAATERANAIASLLETANAAGMAALTQSALANAAYGFQSYQNAESGAFLPTGNGSVGGGIGAFDRDINITVNTGVGDPNAIAEAIENLLREANSRGTLTNGILGIA
jgi:hypothetical protein